MNITNKKIIQFDTWRCKRCNTKETVETILAYYPDGTGSPNQKTNLKEFPIWKPDIPSGWVTICGDILCKNCYQEVKKWIEINQ